MNMGKKNKNKKIKDWYDVYYGEEELDYFEEDFCEETQKIVKMKHYRKKEKREKEIISEREYWKNQQRYD